MAEEKRASPPFSISKPAKFCVYQNPAFSAALTARSLHPSSSSTFLSIFSLSIASSVALFAFISSFREDGFINNIRFLHFSHTAAYFLVKIAKMAMGLVFLAFVSALIHAISLRKTRIAAGVPDVPQKGPNHLTLRQQGLLGLNPRSVQPIAKEPSKPTTPSVPLVPVHLHSASSSGQLGSDKMKLSASGGRLISFSPSISPPSRMPDCPISTSWLRQQRSIAVKEILTEAMLEQFLAEEDEKTVETPSKLETPHQIQMTPPPSLNGFGIASPVSAANASGTTRSTPLRPVRMSPGSHKYTTPPKKGDGDLPPPMSMEQVSQAFENLGVYPHIEQWRDRLRQWFSSVLLNPLAEKIETSHIQVMQAAAKVGISITVNQVGSDPLTMAVPLNGSPIDGTKEWQPTFTMDEDGVLHQLRVALVQTRDASTSQLSISGVQNPQQNPQIPIIQECVDAITEHQRLHTLMKGDWVKGLLPQSSVRADYTVQRVRDLAEGTCLKNYEYLGNGQVYDKKNKKWTLELPTDSHLLLYLFCAFLEHPKWTLHVDPTSYASTQSSKNPLFLGILPPKDRFPEKYVAVISGVPSVLHPGACVLVVGKQSPPIFALYWDKKLQFSLQGRTALWDAILLVCHRIKLSYGSVVRGLHIGSSALGLLPVLDTEIED